MRGLLFQLWITRLWISIYGRTKPLRLRRMLLLILLNLWKFFLLILGPCSFLKHSHRDSSAAKQPQQQQQLRRLSVPQLPVLLPV